MPEITPADLARWQAATEAIALTEPIRFVAPHRFVFLADYEFYLLAREIVPRLLNRVRELESRQPVAASQSAREQVANDEEEASRIAEEAYPYLRMSCEELIAALKAETHDAALVSGFASQVYDHVTRGHISKPLTWPSEVIAVADQMAQEEVDAAVKELEEEIARLEGKSHA